MGFPDLLTSHIFSWIARGNTVRQQQYYPKVLDCLIVRSSHPLRFRSPVLESTFYLKS